jgi:Family of unknown function (DUF5336)
MTYPPGNSGYPPAQSSGSYGAPAAPSFNKADVGESNLKQYLTIAVAVLGVIIYLVSYGPLITHVLPNGDELIEKDPLPIGLALLAGLLAGTSLLPKAKNYSAVVTVVAIVGALLLVEDAIGASGRGWALWAAVATAVIQSALAIYALLLDAGVITPPAPRPKYDQYGQYGQYGYYGQQQAPYQQSGYGTQYGGYLSGPTTGGFSAQPGPQSQQHGSPTPPTGFPSFSPPPSSSGSGAPGQGNSAEHGGSGHSQHSYGQGQQPQAPSSPSGPSQS